MADKDFVIVNINNTQEKVSEGEFVIVPKIKGEAGDKLVFDEILLTAQGDKVVVGKPNVEGAKIDAEIVEQTQGEKVHSRIFKAKSRFRRHTGQRQDLTKVKINKIKF